MKKIKEKIARIQGAKYIAMGNGSSFKATDLR
jgi:hypothetical protein